MVANRQSPRLGNQASSNRISGGSVSRKNGLASGGPKAAYPAIGAAAEAARILSATSRRKAVLNCAASSEVSGGTSLVLLRPGIEAFAMTAMAQGLSATIVPMSPSQ